MISPSGEDNIFEYTSQKENYRNISFPSKHLPENSQTSLTISSAHFVDIYKKNTYIFD